MIPEHVRLEDCLRDLHKAGRPAGSKTKPQPAREGPVWEAFKRWFSSAELARPSLHADLWRAFAAGAESKNEPSTRSNT